MKFESYVGFFNLKRLFSLLKTVNHNCGLEI